MAKITGKEGLVFTGPAKVYDSEEEMLHALERQEIEKGDVIVIRFEGPKGGPGMPEMVTPTSAIVGAGLGKDVALLTDGRFSGASSADFGRSRSAGFFAWFVAPFDIVRVAEMVKQGIEAVAWRDGNFRCTIRPGRQPAWDCRGAFGRWFLRGVVIYDNIAIADGQ